MHSKAYKHLLVFLVLGIASATSFCKYPDKPTLHQWGQTNCEKWKKGLSREYCADTVGQATCPGTNRYICSGRTYTYEDPSTGKSETGFAPACYFFKK
ncbi:hypothetical protein CB0940_05748 [Cercospora beticola]|uniref:Secreted protein n=1 Tax=Cercospora beticola TaxID=122368 RepID=A0A2G5HZL8_CERBT|nr:hypothetical protein CB0940_05748 [Cercospora beticola]PIA97984.1 hypothetical protein CB0940_05748 [Cercospora beticola]WPA98329.1 hypothetical protein RHO25_002941 [Cercospora beticola]